MPQPIFDFDTVIPRRGTDSYKWDYTHEMLGAPDVLPLWVADMDFASPQPVLDALHQRVEHGVFGYTAKGPGYYASVRNWLDRRHGWNVEEPWIANMPGVVAALRLAVDVFSQPGDNIIVQPPVYYPFFKVVKDNGRNILENPLQWTGSRYEMDFQQLETQLKKGAAMFILCSPHNPVGRVWERWELEALSALCLQYGTLLVSDEIWADLVFPGSQHICAANLNPDSAANTITCVAPSKTFNLAGLTTSSVIIPDAGKMRRYKHAIATQDLGLGNILGMTAMRASYDHGEPWLEALLEYLQATIAWVREFLAAQHPHVGWLEPEATYLLWLDLRYLGLDETELRDAFYRRARAGVHLGSKFGTGGPGFVRVNIAAPRSLIQEGFEEIGRALRFLEASV